MAFKIIMPKLGLTMKTGTIIKWLKNEGDAVSEAEPLIEIETEKLSHTIESPGSGALLKKLAGEGEKYPVACVLGYIGRQGEDIIMDEISYASDNTAPTPVSNVQVQAARIPGARVFISPVAKKLAANLELDFTQIPGTGPNGRIVKADVLRYSNSRRAAMPPPHQPHLPDAVVPYSGMRRAIGDNMSAAHLAAPMVTYHVSADATALTEFRAMLNTGVTDKSERVSINDLILKITAAALTKMPIMNSALTDEGIVRYGSVNLGMATAIDGGLVVPVIRYADKKSLIDISREARDLALRARSGKLTLSETEGGTFSVSNLGGYGSVDFFTPIVNAPQAGILGVGRITDSVVAIRGEIKVRPVLGLSLTCDHRVIDGAVAAEFMQCLIRLLDSPARAVL